MFDIGFWEIGVVLIVLLLVLGPKRLPMVAKTAGIWLRRIRQLLDSVKQEANSVIDVDEDKSTSQASDKDKQA